MIAGLASLILATALVALLIQVFPDLGVVWSATVDSIGRDGHVYVVTMGVAAIAVSAIGSLSGGLQR